MQDASITKEYKFKRLATSNQTKLPYAEVFGDSFGGGPFTGCFPGPPVPPLGEAGKVFWGLSLPPPDGAFSGNLESPPLGAVGPKDA